MKRMIAAALVCALVLLAAARAEDDMPKKAGELERRTFTGSAGNVLRYRLLKPENYDPAAKTVYPLVVFLHGAGERGDDNESQLVHGLKEFAKAKTRKQHPCFLIAPQCPSDQKWVEVDWSADRHTTPKEPSEPLGLVVELLDVLQKDYRIDSKRLYVTGLSMGGYGTWDLLARLPNRIAAAMPICGGADEATAPRVAKVPVWAFHGALDTAVQPERTRRMIDALRKAGGLPGHTEYPDVGHDSWSQTYRDPEVLRWLFAQRRK